MILEEIELPFDWFRLQICTISLSPLICPIAKQHNVYINVQQRSFSLSPVFDLHKLPQILVSHLIFSNNDWNRATS